MPVYVHPADVDSVKKPAGRNPPERLRRRLWHRSCLQLLGEALFDGVFLQPLLKEVKLLRQGQQIDLPGNPVVIPVSGHSPGSVAISLPNHGALLSGDALMTADPMFGGSGRAIVFSEHPERDKVALDALELLKPFGRNALLPAHGEPWLEVGSVEKAITSAVIAQ